MRSWWIGCVVLLNFLLHGPAAAFERSCLISGPRYELATDTVEWSMKIARGQSCTRGLRFSNVAIEHVKLVSSPQSGRVTLQGPGFAYTARSDFQGQDSFEILVWGIVNRIHGSSTIHVTVLVGGAPSTARLQAQENPATRVDTARSVPAATQDVSIQVHAFVKAMSQRAQQRKEREIQ